VVRIESGDRALAHGDYEQAAREFEAALAGASDPEVQAAAALGLGKVYLDAGNIPDGLDTLRAVAAPVEAQSSQTTQQQADANYFLARTYQQLGRYGEAADAYAKVLALNPGKIDAYLAERRGDCLADAGDLTGANQAYEIALEAPRLDDGSAVRLKVAENTYLLGDYAAAIQLLDALYNASSSEFIKARADYLIGQAHIYLGQLDTGYTRYLDAVMNFPRAYDSYLALVELVNAGIPVSDLHRGLVDFFAQQYTPAIEALDRYILSTPDYDPAALHYKAMIFRELGEHYSAISLWEALIQKDPGVRFWEAAWEEKAFTLWYYLEDYGAAAQTYLDFVSSYPAHSLAPEYLFQAARNLERDDRLDEAARTWDQVADTYPAAEQAFRSIILAGASRLRLGDLEAARTTFQRGLIFATTPSDQAAALLWVGKMQQAMNDPSAAQASWQQAASRDPTGYYSERARDLMLSRPAFLTSAPFDLAFDLQAERLEAEAWLREKFQIPPETNLAALDTLAFDPRLIRGAEFWRLGQLEEGRAEFESLRQAVVSDPVQSFRLLHYLYDQGVYRSAVLTSRQILDLLGLSDAATLSAPSYFNHIRFGPYYREMVIPYANEEGLSPLLVFSIMRQESMFEGFVRSGAGARGLMQIMPATGEGVASNLGWPPEFNEEDLYRPVVSLRLGLHYLGQQISYLDGDMYGALAAYNGGPGNAQAWYEMAQGDPDLFLEVIRFQETRDYVMRIYEIFSIYRGLYERP
jgi:soluble lytic murein transglycosylase